MGSRRIWLVGMVLAALAGYAYSAIETGDDGSARAISVSSTPAGQQPTVSRPLSGHAYSLAYDPLRDVIWYVITQATTLSGGPPESPVDGVAGAGSIPTQADAELYEANASTGEVVAAFAIPNPNDDTGLGDMVGVAPDQSVWVAESYDLYRVDPATSAVQSVNLPQDVNGALSGANQGTFVTAMTFTNDSVLIGRNNVPALQRWSLGLQRLGDIQLPAGDYAPSYLTTAGSMIEMVTRSTGDASSARGQQASEPLPAGSESPTVQGGAQLQNQYLVDRPDHMTADLRGFDGSSILVVGGSPPTLKWEPEAGAPVQLSWPEIDDQVMSPAGQVVSVHSSPQLEASLMLPNDTLWIIATTSAGPALQLFTSN